MVDPPTKRFYGTDFGIRDPFGNPIRISQRNGASSDEVQAAYDAAGA